MNILALDTADQVLSLALSTGTGVWYTEIDDGVRHSELLLESADALCKIAGLHPENLELVACMKGPGSFTGLRIGFSAAKGMALALGIPLVSLPTLDCLAYHLSIWPGIVLPAMDAKQGRFFSALYRDGHCLTEYKDASPEAIARELTSVRLSPDEKVVLTGSGAELLASFLVSFLPHEHIRIDPESRKGRAKELLKLIKSGTIDMKGNANSGPVYLRKSDAELKSR